MKRLLKRRDFFKCMAGVVAMLALPVELPEVEPEVIGVDMAAEGADTTVVSLHGMSAATPDDLGGFLVPQEYVDEVLGAINVESGRSGVFRGASQTVRWREPSTVRLPADPNLLVDNFRQVHQDFAQFLKGGAA